MRFLLSLCLVATLPVLAVAQRERLSVAEIRSAEQELANLGYWAGPIDGVFDTGSRSALIAFQKWTGREVTAQLNVDELNALRTSIAPHARETGYEHVEVDLDRQVLMLVKEDGSVRVLPVSSGNNKPFTDEGQESIAYTPRGRFLVYAKDVGWKTGSLGSTYYANFISGGVAIHGSRSVPNEPASHGCIRVPMFAAREVSKLLKVGTIVLVYDRLSFVSALDWVKNPKLKAAALANVRIDDAEFVDETTSPRSKSLAKKPRLKMIRA